MTRYVLVLSCADRPGVVHQVTGALLAAGANVVENAQFTDPGSGVFSMRTAFDTEQPAEEVRARLAPVADGLALDYRLRRESRLPRVLLMVSRADHCLVDLLYRRSTGDLPVEVPLIVSNHADLQPVAAAHGIPYVHLPVTPETKAQQEKELLALVDEHAIDLVVLARYMQVLSEDLCEALRGRAINIHHSFLPGFKGARPYHQAHERGVKIIGATAHYVTSDLDEGPIIEQDVVRVTHAATADALVRIGRDVERQVLARAVKYHAEDRVVLIGNRTVVFS